MTDHFFDKFIKDKLNAYESSVPDGLWEKILQERDRKPVGIWWKNYGFFASVGVAAIVLTGTLFLNHTNSNKPSSVTNNIVQPVNVTNSKTPELLTSKTTTQSSPAYDNNVAKSLTSDAGESLANKEKMQSSSPGNIGVVADGSLEKNNTVNPTSYKNNSLHRSTFLQGKFPNNGAFDNRTIIGEDPLLVKNSTSFFTKPVLLATIQNDKKLNSLLSNEKFLEGRKDFKLFGVDCPSARGPVRNDLYIEIFGSPDYAKKTINNSNAANATFLQRKDSTESRRLSYTAGFRLTKNIGENMLIKAGLQYSQINEKFTYRSENERKLTTVITIRTVIRSAGDTVMIRDTSTVEQIGYRVKTTYNRYRSIDLPLLLGYEWGNDNLKFSASGGVILNLYSWQKGESLDTSFVPVAFNKNTGQTFKQNIGIGLYAGISALKKVGERSELFMEPYFRYNISNMTNNKSLFNQKFQVAGINIGVRYKLNGQRQR